jgi:predicted helicase
LISSKCSTGRLTFLNRVDRKAFFENFEEGHAVQYFYEPFLQAFDPELRKELGVWYTPIEIVKYMVARVDTVLREELDIPDGLADPRVYVLDPSCGTGAYLVEVLHKIHATLKAKGEDALAANDLKRAAMDRVFGFEILPAPFVVSHLQLGLLLQNLGAPLTDSLNERVGVYLTNALTGWEPPSDEVKARLQQLAFSFAELKSEHDAADRVKREVPILVILGNPPYNGFAGVAVEEERDLSKAYRTTVKAAPPQGQGLNDLYVRFFRMAERRIVDKSGKGIICFISNYSWLDGLSFTGMRERYLTAFDEIWIDNLHGDRIISEYSPDGKTSETVFALEGTSPGIKIGTAVSLLVLKEGHENSRGVVRYRDMNQARAAERRGALIASLDDPDFSAGYINLKPAIEIGLPLKPRATSESYFDWPLLPELFPASFPGVKTSRDGFLVDMDRERLIQRLETYFDPKITNEGMRRIAPEGMSTTARFNAEEARDYLCKRGFKRENVVRYSYRPFDTRWLYWEPETKLLDEKRTEYFPQVWKGNVWLSAGQRNRMESFYQPQFTTLLADHHIVESNVGMFPLYLRNATKQDSLLTAKSLDEVEPNVTPVAQSYAEEYKVEVSDLFYHVLAVLHAPHYRIENAGALRQDWPRIPLPSTKDALLHSAELGRKIAALLDTEQGVAGVTAGTPGDPFRSVGNVTHVAGKPLDPVEDLKVTAGWGHAGKGGVTMPGKGKLIERDYSTDERKAIERSASEPSLTVGLLPHDGEAGALAQASARAQSVFDLLGQTTYDVYLNDVAYWKNIPARVWDYTIGGYQVIKKWLSYRELELLSRPLTPDEAREVTNMARRIAAIVLLEPALDANYQAVKTATYSWRSA